ncbi:uncharacterized protein LOC133194634 [Saccostrea echinata]|uniref:uncharacterized protein LOC133194634 n=1 Tax=Saccostrea echinata TaxID=191078 RepID=UPI002A835696|nr:uncharacterized protein LOC133194634 [Saccostrea echinata]
MSSILTGTLIVFLLILNAYAYDNLSEGRSIVVYNTTKLSNGVRIYKASSCFPFENFEILTLVVDLLDVRSVYQIEFTIGPQSRLGSYIWRVIGGWSIFISNSSSTDSGSLYASGTLNNKEISVFVTKQKHGRFMVLKYAANTQNQSVPFCTFKVFGCDMGVFGTNCNVNCSKNCIGKSCDIIDGRCLSGRCTDGWQGNNCNLKFSDKAFFPNFTKKYDICKDSAGKFNNVTAVSDKLCIARNKSGKCDSSAQHAEETQPEVYGLLAAFIVSTLVNCVFLTVYCKRFMLKRRKRTSLQTTLAPIYANEPEENQNQRSGQEQDESEMKIYYETLQASSNEPDKHNYASFK